jgi:hypothetical protein
LDLYWSGAARAALRGGSEVEPTKAPQKRRSNIVLERKCHADPT